MSSNCSSFNTTIFSINLLKFKFWGQNYSKKFKETKRGNGLRPQHIERQYIADATGEMVRGIRGDRFPLIGVNQVGRGTLFLDF